MQTDFPPAKTGLISSLQYYSNQQDSTQLISSNFTNKKNKAIKVKGKYIVERPLCNIYGTCQHL